MRVSSVLDTELLRAVTDLGFAQPTPIQHKAIPPAAKGRDLLACAMTGSGKTAAFVLPVLQRLKGKRRGTTRALILTPTRELAAQIVEHFDDLARYTSVKAAAIYGGVGFGPQEKALRKGVDVIVACPGRLLDHFRQPYARLAGLEILVLDEADRMLDMGFLPDIRRIIDHLPKVQQTLLFSATMPRPIVQLSQQLLKDPVRIDVERQAAPATGVSQTLFPIRQDLKSALLMSLIESGEIHDALVFTRTKHRANRLAQYLSKRGVAADRIHGNRTQGQRARALADFKSGKTQILVATDIAARGIDVEALSHVVNFDVPHLPEDYIHRVGRTARAKATGEAFTFFSPQEKNDLYAIENAVGKRLPQRKVEGFAHDAPAAEELEIPLAERMAQMRAKRAEDRARANAKKARKARATSDRSQTARPKGKPASRKTKEQHDGSQGHRPKSAKGGRPGGRGAAAGGRGAAGGGRGAAAGAGGRGPRKRRSSRRRGRPANASR